MKAVGRWLKNALLRPRRLHVETGAAARPPELVKKVLRPYRAISRQPPDIHRRRISRRSDVAHERPARFVLIMPPSPLRHKCSRLPAPRRRRAARVAVGLKSKVLCCCVGVGGEFEKFSDWASLHEVCSDEPGEGERALDDPVGIVGQAQQQKGDQRDRDLNANGVLEVPRKWLIFKVCLTHRKNNSMAHRRLYKSAISCALAVRSLVKMRNTFPVSITT